MNTVRLIAALLWQALVIRLAVELLSDVSNSKRHRCTWNAAFYSAMLMAAIDVVGMFLLGLFPFGLAMGWVLRFAAALALFHLHFGLSRLRALAMVPLLAVAAAVWRHFVEPLIPGL